MSAIIRKDAEWLEIELDRPRRVLRLDVDPRDFSGVFYVDASQWTVPALQPIEPAEFEQVLDAIWADSRGGVPLLQHHQGVEVLLRAAPGRALVGTSQTANNRAWVTLLEPGRSYRLAVALDYPHGLPVARLLREHAQRVYPAVTALEDTEWQVICERLVSLEEASFYRDYWRLKWRLPE